MLANINNYLKDVFFRIKHGEDQWHVEVNESTESFELLKNKRVVRGVEIKDIAKVTITMDSAITYDAELIVINFNNEEAITISEDVNNYKGLLEFLAKKRLIEESN